MGHGGTTILSLSNELLLQILEADLSRATLAGCLRCCKRMNLLVTPILYQHVILDTQSLTKWASHPSPANDALVQTLTLRFDGVQRTRSMTFEAGGTARAMHRLQTDLEKLLPLRLAEMINLQSFSLYSPRELPIGLWIPASSIVAILDHLPESCIALELDVRDTQKPRTLRISGENDHICPVVRERLDTLRFLRLQLSRVCPSLVGAGYVAYPHWMSEAEGYAAFSHFEMADTPNLEECTITANYDMGLRNMKITEVCDPSNGGVQAVGAVVSTMGEALYRLSSSGRAPRLWRAWMIGARRIRAVDLPHRALLRHDVLAGKSLLLPFDNLGRAKLDLDLGETDDIFIRLPANQGGGSDGAVGGAGETRDFVSTLDGVRALAEDHAWLSATNGARVPFPLLIDGMGASLTLAPEPSIRTASEFSAVSTLSGTLWESEMATGEQMLGCDEVTLSNSIPIVRSAPPGSISNRREVLLDNAL
ncbi:hypothetical protein BX600DRAFT_511919 [Xylariales sp. PMI_506]|nr:hypothetical protein BX600DRAFT_511919 [Xylariales sp. PMI_506]